MSSDHERFTACWHENAPRVLAFCVRHVGHDDAPDVVAETFLVAWRRWPAITDPAIAWLLVTARGVIANRIRSARRRRALADRVALLDGAAAGSAGSGETALARQEALEQLARLDEHHREALLLLAWDGLSGAEAAEVLGIRPETFRRRVSRARAALRSAGDSPPSPPSPPPRAPRLARLTLTEENR